MSTKNVMMEKEARNKLYSMWENGEVPSNFTEDHSHYSDALKQLMKNGYVEWEDIL
jgi:hypothetical protein